MKDISKRLASSLSRIGPRAVYGQTLYEMASSNALIIAASSDLGRSSGLDRFSRDFPNQFINTGIAEQNLVGISSGLARLGFNVFASTFAPFASLRASEQIRMNLSYMQEPVNVVGLASGLALGFLGNSHYGLEDISVLRSMPNLTIVAPCDCVELIKALHALVEYNRPSYLRMTGSVGMPVVHNQDYEFKIGEAYEIFPIARTTVLAHGATVGYAKNAIEELRNNNLEVGLVNFSTIKPLDAEKIASIATIAENIVIVEEHNIVGGLGSSVIEFLSDFQLNKGKNIIRHGVLDAYPKAGTYEYVLENLKLDTKGIKKVLLDIIAK